MSVITRHIPDGCLLCLCFTIHSFAHPFQGTAVLPQNPATGICRRCSCGTSSRKKPSALCSSIYHPFQTSAEKIAHVITAERQHGEWVITNADIIQDCRVGSEAAVAPMKRRASQSNASVTSGTTPETASTENKRCRIGTPSGFFPVRRNDRTLGCPEVVKRELACAGRFFAGQCPVFALSRVD